MAAGDETLLISVSEAASRLGIGINRTRDLIRCGELAAVKGKRKFLVPVWALDEYTRSAATK